MNSTCKSQRFLSLCAHAIAFLALACSVTLFVFMVGCSSNKSLATPPPPQSVTVSVSSSVSSVLLGNTLQFTATVTGTSNTAVTWSVNSVAGGNSTVGTITNAGLYTAPVDLPNPTNVNIQATSQADASASGSTAVIITSDITVAVATNPANTSTVTPGGTVQLIATVASAGHPDVKVNWSANGVANGNSTVGTIAVTGADTATYTAPGSLPNPNPATITATSVADSRTFASLSLTIKSAVQVTVMPSPVTVRTGATLQFTSAVTGTTNTNVNWAVNSVLGGSSTLGTISAAGLYLAPASVPSQNPVTISATSVSDPTVSGNAPVTVIAAVSNQFTINYLSTMQAAPFSLLTVNGSGWDPSQPVVVRFTIGGGSQVDVPALYTTATQIVVGVPPLIDLSNSTTSAGQVPLQVMQTSASATTTSNTFSGLQVVDLPVSNLPPGTTITGLIDGLVLVSKDLEVQLAYDELASGGQASTTQLRSTLEAVIAQAAQLKTQFRALFSNPANTFPLANGSQLIVDQNSTVLTERILFAWLARLDSVIQTGQTASAALRMRSVSQASVSIAGAPAVCSFSQSCPDQAYITPARPPVLQPAGTSFGDGMDAFLQVVTALASAASKSVGDVSSLVSLTSAIRITFPGVGAYVHDTILLAAPGGNQAVQQRLANADVLALQAQQPGIAKAAVDVLGVALGEADPLAGLIFGILPAMASLDAQLPAQGLQPAAFFVKGTVTSNLNQPISGALVTCSNFSFWANGFAVTLGDDSFSSAVPPNSTTLNVPTILTCVVNKSGFQSSQLQIDLTKPGISYPVILNQAALFTDPNSLSFTATQGGTNPSAKALNVESSLSGGTNWTAQTDALWLRISVSAGATPTAIQVSVDITGLLAGPYTGNVIFTPAAASTSPVNVPVTLQVTSPNSETWTGTITGTLEDQFCTGATTNGSWSISYQITVVASGSLVSGIQSGSVSGNGSSSGAITVVTQPVNPQEPGCQLVSSSASNVQVNILTIPGTQPGGPQIQVTEAPGQSQDFIPICRSASDRQLGCEDMGGFVLVPTAISATSISGTWSGNNDLVFTSGGGTFMLAKQ
ncbi:MAG TPA: hypothetical protein VNZ03_01185 [Terriglobales bacterium]|jgi:hypothetical protein|nr:hypothetical protein [Terriglobales bacterium]